MIVCVCRGASDRDVNRAIDRGASSVADLQRCGIGTECGSCHNLLRKMLAAARAADDAHPCTMPQAGVPVAHTEAEASAA